MQYKGIVTRIILMLIGVFFAAAGVSFSLKAELGTSPIGSCPAVFSGPLNLSVGIVMGIVCALFVVGQIIILKKKFQPFQLLQLVLAYLFGYMIDLTSSMMQAFKVDTIFLQIVMCLLGMVVLALGVFMLLKVDLLMLAPDAFAATVSKKFNLEFSKTKVILDCFMVAIAAVGSLIIYREIRHVGVGTLAAALLVGRIIGGMKSLKPLNQILDQITEQGTRLPAAETD
ncbi:MAG: YczE/YyaS/YitT family protein [Christensenellales bacterium]|jgi:uncharacterized membrane protein YczE